MTHLGERWMRRGLGVGALAALLACGGGSGGAPEDRVTWVLVPENPAYVAYREAVLAGVPVPEQAPTRFRAEDFARVGGRVPAVVAPPSVGGFCVFPESFDLRALGRSTPARVPVCPCGSCWTTATLGSLESSIAPWTWRDLSEGHLQLGAWHGATCFLGAGPEWALPYLASWRGPVDEASYDACQGVRDEGGRLTGDVHVQNVWFLPRRQGALDLCWIKWAVMHLGGLYAASSHDINGAQGTVYYPLPGGEIHAMTLVGWDDHFDRHRFYCDRPNVAPSQRVPPGDGAFLAKDNLGPTVGDAGHYWVSYYDGSFAQEPVAFTGEPVGNYGRIYQWDPRGQLKFLSPVVADATQLSAWQGNVFTARAEEDLVAVSLYEMTYGASEYEVRVDLDPVDGPTNPAGPAATFQASLPMQGYFTLRLPHPVRVQKGQRFGVAVRGRDLVSGLPSFLAVETPEGADPTVVAAPGQSFVSVDGVAWKDLTTLAYDKGDGKGTKVSLAQANLRLKAFADPVVGASASVLPPDFSVAWELHNDGTQDAWVRPSGQRRVPGRDGFEELGDAFFATRWTDASRVLAPTDDGWVLVPPGGRITALSEPFVLSFGDQLSWRTSVLESADGVDVVPGLVHYLNDLLATPIHVVASDPAPGAVVPVPQVSVLTVTYDVPLKAGPGLLGITVTSGSQTRNVYAKVLGNVLQIVPSKPLTGGPGLGGTAWHLHVPQDAAVSSDLGNPLVADHEVSFTIQGVN